MIDNEEKHRWNAITNVDKFLRSNQVSQEEIDKTLAPYWIYWKRYYQTLPKWEEDSPKVKHLFELIKDRTEINF